MLFLLLQLTTTTTTKTKKKNCPEGCLNPIASSLFSPSWSVDPVSCSIWPPPKSWWHLSWPKTSASSRALTPVHVPRAPPSPLEKHLQLLRRSVLGEVVLDANPKHAKLPSFMVFCFETLTFRMFQALQANKLKTAETLCAESRFSTYRRGLNKPCSTSGALTRTNFSRHICRATYAERRS